MLLLLFLALLYIYQVERIGETNQYMCKDQYGNYSLFNVEKVLDYKVLLDIYTVEQENNAIFNICALFSDIYLV